MIKRPNDAKNRWTRGRYSPPTLSVYGGVLDLTASGTQPPTENTGTGGAIKRP